MFAALFTAKMPKSASNGHSISDLPWQCQYPKTDFVDLEERTATLEPLPQEARAQICVRRRLRTRPEGAFSRLQGSQRAGDGGGVERELDLLEGSRE